MYIHSSFRNKTVYNELLVLHRVRMLYYYFYCAYLTKNKIIINAVYWVLSENPKN